MTKSERDYVTYCYNFLLLYGSLYTLTRIALENENNKFLDRRETDSSAHNTDLGDNLNYTFQYDYSDYYAHRFYKVGGRYYGYDANGNITVERDGEYNIGYVYENVKVGISNDGRDIYRLNWAIGIEEQPKVRADVYQKSYEYDERNRLLYARDNFSLYSIYRYDESGERSNKYNYFSEEETLYVNRYYSTSINSLNREYEGQSIKHIFLNNERLVTKTALNKINGTEQAYSDYERSHTYYYHSDHLGSATLITDYKGKEYQRIKYTPYGESWIELSKNIDNYLPYRFTGKELDEETGFYYYGQRYLDPRYSIWHTSDPAIYDYMSQSKEGEGGIYNVTNLNLYHYAGNNPIKYIDLDGRIEFDIGLRADAGGGAAVGVEAGIAIAYSFKDGFSFGLYSKEYVGAEFGASAFIGGSVSVDFGTNKIDSGNTFSFIMGGSADVTPLTGIGIDVLFDVDSRAFSGAFSIKGGLGVSLLPVEGHTSFVATQKLNIADYFINTNIYKDLSKFIKETNVYSSISSFNDYMEGNIPFWDFIKHPIRNTAMLVGKLINVIN